MPAFLNNLPHNGIQPFPQAMNGKAAVSDSVHLLLPIKELDDIHYGLAYACQLLHRQVTLDVSLLHVNRPAPRTGLFSSLFYDGLFDDIRAEMLINDAQCRLTRSGITHHSCIRSGEVVFSILDAAEMLNCSEVVLPYRSRTCWSMFLPSTTKKLLHAARSVPIVSVDGQGRVAGRSGQSPWAPPLGSLRHKYEHQVQEAHEQL